MVEQGAAWSVPVWQGEAWTLQKKILNKIWACQGLALHSVVMLSMAKSGSVMPGNVWPCTAMSGKVLWSKAR